MGSSKKVLNLDAATFEGGSDVHKDPVTKDKKERDQISHRNTYETTEKIDVY